MRTVLALMNRNRKLFFKDKGMLFTSMITPVILIVLYATFLAKVFRDSFTAAIPDVITISDKLINGTVAAQLTASDRKSTRLNSSHNNQSRMPSSA